MAVVLKYAPARKDPASSVLPYAGKAEGRVRTISSGAVSIANGDSIGSRIYFGKMPSHAVPLAFMSNLGHGAVTSVNDFDVGLEKDGVEVDWDIFADGIDISAAGNKNPMVTISVANQGKALWELLGLTKDPGVEYDVVGTLKVAATATASVSAFLSYAVK